MSYPEPMNAARPLAVVTGACGRLGTVLVDAFLTAGYRVIGLDRIVSEAISVPVLPFSAHDEQSVEDAFRRVWTEYGVPAVVVHAIGTWAMKPFAETALSDWNRVMEINLTSTFLVFREAVRLMQGADEPSSGRLIGITSKQGSLRGVAEQAAYSASKAGVQRLVESLSAEMSGTGITVHAVAPSMILFDGGDGQGVAAEDIAAHCLHLATEAGASLNGTTLLAFGE